jgi:hypothetical protein
MGRANRRRAGCGRPPGLRACAPVAGTRFDQLGWAGLQPAGSREGRRIRRCCAGRDAHRSQRRSWVKGPPVFGLGAPPNARGLQPRRISAATMLFRPPRRHPLRLIWLQLQSKDRDQPPAPAAGLYAWTDAEPVCLRIDSSLHGGQKLNFVDRDADFMVGDVGCEISEAQRGGDQLCCAP